MMTKRFKAKGMHCTSCEELIKRAAKKIDGVNEIVVDYVTEKVEVNFDEDKTSLGTIRDIVEEKGYETSLIEESTKQETKKILAPQYIQLNSVLVRDVTLPPTIKTAIERKLKQEQESLEYEFRLVTAKKEAEKQIIEAQGKADANRILSASLNDKILQDKGIEATIKLSQSPNSKVVIIGSGKSGMPIILGNQ